MPSLITALPSIPRSKAGKQRRESSTDNRGSRSCLKAVFLLREKAGK